MESGSGDNGEEACEIKAPIQTIRKSISNLSEKINQIAAEVTNPEKAKRKNLLSKLILFWELRFYESGREFVTSQVTDFIYEKFLKDDFPRWRLVLWGMMMSIIMTGIFVYYMYLSFTQNYQTQKFVALSPDSGKCNAIPKSWTLITKADSNGNWEGQQSYLDSQAMYYFIFNNLQVDSNQFQELMSSFKESLSVAAAQMSQLNLAINIVYWVAWGTFVTVAVKPPDDDSIEQGPSDSSIQQLVTMADAKYVLMSDYITGTYSSEKGGDCGIDNLKSGYNSATGKLFLNLNVSAVNLVATCNRTLNFVELGYYSVFQGLDFQIAVDGQTLYATIAINLGIVPYSYYTYVDASFKAIGFALGKGGISFSVVRLYDPIYPSMDPFYCVGPSDPKFSNLKWFCLVKIGNTYGLPFTQHVGSDITKPSKCVCGAGFNYHGNCNKKMLYTGVLVYDHNKNASAVAGVADAYKPFVPFLQLFYVEKRTLAQINDKVYDPAWAAYPGQMYYSSFTPESKAWRKQAYSFSNTRSFGTASIINWLTYSASDLTVSQNKYQLRNGSCSPSILSPNFETLYAGANSFAPLIETYLACTMNFIDAFLNAAGIAVGVTSLLSPVPFLLFVWLWFQFRLFYNHYAGETDKLQKAAFNVIEGGAAQ